MTCLQGRFWGHHTQLAMTLVKHPWSIHRCNTLRTMRSDPAAVAGDISRSSAIGTSNIRVSSIIIRAMIPRDRVRGQGEMMEDGRPRTGGRKMEGENHRTQ